MYIFRKFSNNIVNKQNAKDIFTLLLSSIIDRFKKDDEPNLSTRSQFQFKIEC